MENKENKAIWEYKAKNGEWRNCDEQWASLAFSLNLRQVRLSEIVIDEKATR